MSLQAESCKAVSPEGYACVKPSSHEDEHAAPLGYHPEPYNQMEWFTWPQDDGPRQEGAE